MDLKIDQSAVIELAATKIADELFDRHEDISFRASELIENRVDKIFSEEAEAKVKEAINSAVQDALDREYSKITPWGERDGAPTTIRKELSQLADGYWTTKVDSRTGKPTDSSYNAVTRAQFVMGEICAKDFTEQMKHAAVSVTAAMKDSFRAQFARDVDQLLDKLFHVKSVQDQGKAEKPWW